MPLPGQSPNIGKKVPTACGDRTRDQSIKSRTLYLTELRRPVLQEYEHSRHMVQLSALGWSFWWTIRRRVALHPAYTGDWSSGMILA